MRLSPRLLRPLSALLLLLVAVGLYQGRRAFIRSFFADGEVRVAGAPRGSATDAEIAPVERLRVVLIDGLGAAHAEALPNLSERCAEGVELRVDVGFPTVSLPVQHVLWTGRTQQESGILYRIPALAEPPVDALPRFVSARAVAESHPAIVHSFGFDVAEPPLVAGDPEALPPGWREGFPARAAAAVAGDERLVFVHILRVDEAGHTAGGASPEYAAAAAEADAILGDLVGAGEADAGSTRWLVLADHGHRPDGGHGGPEPAIRVVRACVFGAGTAPASGSTIDATLSDIARLLGGSVGVGPSPGAAGRPWSEVVAGDPAAQLPSPSLGRWIAAALVGLGILAAALVAAGRRLRWAPLAWPTLAYVGVVAGVGWPTLSNPAIYPPVGAAILGAAWPGWIAAVLTLFIARRHLSSVRAAVAVAGGGWALVAGTALLAGVGDGPPLQPIWSAAASTAMILAWPVTAAAAVVAAMPTSASASREPG
ncbi:MAG: alkaline phosphatase family protein [Myxococcales bacterium]|nr:alkaline phosphatase family protein [Myxococcales bacterium]